MTHRASRILILSAAAAMAFSLSAVDARAEKCSPQDPESTTKGKRVADVVYKLYLPVVGGLDYTVSQKTRFVPDSWEIGCEIETRAGRAEKHYIFFGPQTDGKRVFGKMTGLGEKCSPDEDVGELVDADKLGKWPGVWKPSLVLHLRQDHVVRKNKYVQAGWKPGCLFIHMQTARGAIYANYMGDPQDLPPVDVPPAEAENTDTSMNVTIAKPSLPAYTRQGGALNKATDDFAGRYK